MAEYGSIFFLSAIIAGVFFGGGFGGVSYSRLMMQSSYFLKSLCFLIIPIK